MGGSYQEYIENGFSRTPSKVYGILVAELDTPISQMVRERWNELHYALGDKITIIFFVTPEKWPRDFEERWKSRLVPKDANLDENERDARLKAIDWWKSTLDSWQQSREPGEVIAAGKKLGLKYKQLPCLVLFTKNEAEEQIELPIPKWNKDELYAYFQSAIDALTSCVNEQPDDDAARLQCLAKSLADYRRKSFLSHFAIGAKEQISALKIKEIRVGYRDLVGVVVGPK